MAEGSNRVIDVALRPFPTVSGRITDRAAPRTSYANIISLPRISLRTTKVTVKVLTSGKPVQIDGLHSSRV